MRGDCTEVLRAVLPDLDIQELKIDAASLRKTASRVAKGPQYSKRPELQSTFNFIPFLAPIVCAGKGRRGLGCFQYLFRHVVESLFDYSFRYYVRVLCRLLSLFCSSVFSGTMFVRSLLLSLFLDVVPSALWKSHCSENYALTLSN